MNDELHDPQIASMLGRASGAYPDANVAYVAVRGKVRQAKRRRTFVAGTAACAMFLGVATVAAQTGGTDSQISPAGTLTTVADDTEVSTTDVTTSASDTTAPSTESSSSTSNTSNGGTTATSGTTGSSTSNSSGSSSKPTVPAGPQTTDSEGGSLAFSNDGGTLTFVMATPAAGFHEDADARVVEAHKLRVEFTDGTTTWRIEVRTEGGKMPVEVTQHG